MVSGFGEDLDDKSKAICKKFWVTIAVGTKQKYVTNHRR